MKIIDLLNKIANGEEVPKKIELIHTEYIYNDKEKEYQRYNEKLDLHYGLGEDRRLDLCLDDEVKILENEVLEEEKKIPEKLEEFDIQGLEVAGYSMTQAEYLLEDGVKENRKMINWILDYLKSKGDE